MSVLLGHLVVFLEASVTESEEDERGRYVWVVVTSPRSDFAWQIERPTPENGQRFQLTPLRERAGEFLPAGNTIGCVTREAVEFAMLHPFACRDLGLSRQAGD